MASCPHPRGSGLLDPRPRYALVPGNSLIQLVIEQVFRGVPQAKSAASPADPPVSASQAVVAVHEAGPFVEPQGWRTTAANGGCFLAGNRPQWN